MMPDPAAAGSHVFYRKLTRRYPRIVRAEGCYLSMTRAAGTSTGAAARSRSTWDTESRRSPARIGDQARTLGYVNGTAFTHEPVEELAAEMARLSPGDLELVYPLASGSEAVEAALKLARQYWVEVGRAGQAQGGRARTVLSRQHAAGPLRLGAASTTRRCFRRMAGRGRAGTGTLRVSLRVRRYAAATARRAAAKRWRQPSCATGPTRWPRSSRSRWAARPPAPRCRPRSIGVGCGRSATGTRSCWWPTRC